MGSGPRYVHRQGEPPQYPPPPYPPPQYPPPPYCPQPRQGGGLPAWAIVLIVVGSLCVVAVFLAAFLLPVLSAPTGIARRAKCANKQRQISLGLQMYLNNFDDYFPPAYVAHKPTAATSDGSRFEHLAYWRFLIHEHAEAGFSHLLQKERGETVAQKVARDRLFWTDPAEGYTADYFAPRIFNGQVDTDGTVKTTGLPAADKFEGHIARPQATQTVPSSQLPLLTEGDVGYRVADPSDWKDRPATTHRDLLKTGWTMAPLPGGGANDDVLIGVGRATREADKTPVADRSKKLHYRYDFRHNGSVNILFLDGHVDMVPETNRARVDAVTGAWNSVTPTP